MKKILLLAFVLVAASCAKEDFSVKDVGEQLRLSFESAEQFIDTYDELCSLDYDELLAWTKGHNYWSLLNVIHNCKDEQMQKMPHSFQALFNEKMEVEIEGNVVVFQQGEIYAMLPEGLVPYGSTKATSLDESLDAPTRSDSFSFNWGKIGGKRQHEFYYSASHRKFKYVHEFIDIQTKVSGINHRALVLIIKLEYKGNDWYVAGEPRDVDIKLVGTATGNGQSFDFNITKKLNMVIGNRTYTLGSVKSDSATSKTWSVSIPGNTSYIQQEITEYYTTRWKDFR